MRRLLQSACLATIAATAVLATGCSSGNDQSSDTTAESPAANAPTSSNAQPGRPTLTASSLQPPPPYSKNSGRPNVVFDPCTWIPDDAVSKAGIDPNTRQRGDDQIAEQTFLICKFKTDTRYLTVMSGNVTWDEDLQKNGGWSEPTNVNGREALWVHDPGVKRGCEIHMRTKVGFVDILSTLTIDGGVQGIKPCDNLLDIATAIEPSIGKDN
ncbi:DUF3558 domain-containing protein [Nocardia sp. BMG51109]|uniref:DUF3558 domain-containing protein n=1 Tax=Nocardia sp. BMG51109 TaxID=1056816 RepID=UPI0009FD3D9E|nr:DUF3558 domain-containing protein [Nocardia sp. BMG51109]